MRPPERLKLLLIPGTTFPQAVHLVVNLFGIEGSKLFAQLLQSFLGSDVRYHVKYMDLCRTKSN